MGDADRISVVGDVMVDHLMQQKKAGREKKGCRLFFDHDFYGNILLRMHTKSKKTAYKLEDNIVRLYQNHQANGKSTIEIDQPQIMIFIRNADPQDLKSFFNILVQIKEHPETARDLELFKPDPTEIEK